MLEPPFVKPTSPSVSIWEWECEIWHGDVLYRIVPTIIQARTFEEARRTLQTVIDQYYPSRFPDANIMITKPLTLRPDTAD